MKTHASLQFYFHEAACTANRKQNIQKWKFRGTLLLIFTSPKLTHLHITADVCMETLCRNGRSTPSRLIALLGYSAAQVYWTQLEHEHEWGSTSLFMLIFQLCVWYGSEELYPNNAIPTSPNTSLNQDWEANKCAVLHTHSVLFDHTSLLGDKATYVHFRQSTFTGWWTLLSFQGQNRNWLP